MIRLSKDQSLKLDELLRAFGEASAIREHTFMPLFDGDQKKAASYISVLVEQGLVREEIKIDEAIIPLVLLKTHKANLFIENGGFLHLYELAAKEDYFKQLEEENVKLEIDKAKYERTLRAQDQRIRDLDERIKHIEVLEKYKWLIGGGIVVLSALLSHVLPYMDNLSSNLFDLIN